MKDKNGNKRKLSSRYISWLVASLLFITIFFLIMVFDCRILDKYKTAEIIKINGYSETDRVFTSGKQAITFLINGEEFTAYYQQPIVRKGVYIRVGDKVQYLVDDPNIIQLRRPTEIAILSCTEAFLIASIIGTTIYEIKKGM